MLARISLSASSLLGAACAPCKRRSGTSRWRRRSAYTAVSGREIRAVSEAADWRAEAIDRLDPLERP